MSALVLAIPVISARTGRDVIIVGGLAVVCRLMRPYRATSDLDTVSRRHHGEPAQLELLLASGAKPSGVSGVLVPTTAGPVQVDVLEVTDDDLAQLPDDPTDRLHVLSHAWAATSATPVTIRTAELPDLTVAVAEPGALVAMKLQSIMNRGAARRRREPTYSTSSVCASTPQQGRFSVRSSPAPRRNFVQTPLVTPGDGSTSTPPGRSVWYKSSPKAARQNSTISTWSANCSKPH
jgi:hypothetical protein